jgi:hypothetical protein
MVDKERNHRIDKAHNLMNLVQELVSSRTNQQELELFNCIVYSIG